MKHFKWKACGKRRIHEKPRASEVFACSAWLDAELALIEPKILVCLGATASQSLFGKDFRVTKMSGKWIDSTYADRAIATIHPSAILRTPSDRRPDVYSGFVADMTKVAGELRKS